MKVTRMVAMVFSLLFAGSVLAEEAKTDNIDLVPGDAEKCIQVLLIDHTEIIDQQNIIFYMKGKSLYRNSLPVPCPGLDKNDSFEYRTATSQLCNVDSITVLIRAGSEFLSGASCALGQFYPATQDDVAQLKIQVQEE